MRMSEYHHRSAIAHTCTECGRVLLRGKSSGLRVDLREELPAWHSSSLEPGARSVCLQARLSQRVIHRNKLLGMNETQPQSTYICYGCTVNRYGTISTYPGVCSEGRPGDLESLLPGMDTGLNAVFHRKKSTIYYNRICGCVYVCVGWASTLHLENKPDWMGCTEVGVANVSTAEKLLLKLCLILLEILHSPNPNDYLYVYIKLTFCRHINDSAVY